MKFFEIEAAMTSLLSLGRNIPCNDKRGLSGMWRTNSGFVWISSDLMWEMSDVSDELGGFRFVSEESTVLCWGRVNASIELCVELGESVSLIYWRDCSVGGGMGSGGYGKHECTPCILLDKSGRVYKEAIPFEAEGIRFGVYLKSSTIAEETMELLSDACFIVYDEKKKCGRGYSVELVVVDDEHVLCLPTESGSSSVDSFCWDGFVGGVVGWEDVLIRLVISGAVLWEMWIPAYKNNSIGGGRVSGSEGGLEWGVGNVVPSSLGKERFLLWQLFGFMEKDWDPPGLSCDLDWSSIGRFGWYNGMNGKYIRVVLTSIFNVGDCGLVGDDDVGSRSGLRQKDVKKIFKRLIFSSSGDTVEQMHLSSGLLVSALPLSSLPPFKDGLFCASCGVGCVHVAQRKWILHVTDPSSALNEDGVFTGEDSGYKGFVVVQCKLGPQAVASGIGVESGCDGVCKECGRGAGWPNNGFLIIRENIKLYYSEIDGCGVGVKGVREWVYNLGRKCTRLFPSVVQNPWVERFNGVGGVGGFGEEMLCVGDVVSKFG